MSKKEDYGSRFLYAEDLLQSGEYRSPIVEIAEFIPPNTLRAANGKVIDKPTIRFAGKDKMLVLCNTNVSMIIYCTGEHEREKWIGHRIKLQARIIEAFGDRVVAIRVITPEGVLVRRSILKRLGEVAVWTPSTPPPAKPKSEAKQEAPATPAEDEGKPANIYAALKAKLGKANSPSALQTVRSAVQIASDEGAIDVDQTRTLFAHVDSKQEELDKKAVGATA